MKYLFSAFVLLIFVSCGSNESDESGEQNTYEPLPYIGQHDAFITTENGTEKWDTIYYTIPKFEFINQDCVTVNNETVKGHVYVANFFFTSCPSICPAMMEQMKRLQEMTADVDELIILSHTIDPDRDSIGKLNQFIADKEIDTHNWHFLYNEREYVHFIAREGYLLSANKDDNADGGFIHSDFFTLVDREGHIRGMYQGTVTEEVDKLAEDIKKLIKNEYN
ncbi:SCO family protein [Paracrocinitomix mangrovi]|uniref:SCO family protein n=1 Tax=Paracrocinitomix mangrovi TaxID=2862509 RepID=UPI001C8E64D5|nr:SCO family protein [Paracrocinitomix mangrovi]UKN03429.1 SCO family protein [Paracrocinitomix mangrovi]